MIHNIFYSFFKTTTIFNILRSFIKAKFINFGLLNYSEWNGFFLSKWLAKFDSTLYVGGRRAHAHKLYCLKLDFWVFPYFPNWKTYCNTKMCEQAKIIKLKFWKLKYKLAWCLYSLALGQNIREITLCFGQSFN